GLYLAGGWRYQGEVGAQGSVGERIRLQGQRPAVRDHVARRRRQGRRHRTRRRPVEGGDGREEMKRRGFTLIELTVVLAVLVIASGIVIVRVTGWSSRQALH